MADKRELTDILKISEPLMRRRVQKSGELVTSDLIAEILDRVELLEPELFDDMNKETVIDEMIRRSSHGIGKIATLKSGEDHEVWLTADRKQDWRYWRRYAEYMDEKLPWKAMEGLDGSTDEILGNLEDPKRQGSWDRRGLVVGHVQSGKTGNYTGLICKAADAGYKIIIVLAGLHNNLRAQTQIRLDEGFLGYATLVNVDSLPPVGVGVLDPSHEIKPNCATNRSDKGDFDKTTSRKLAVKPEERPWLFVIKKNKTVLERLLYWVENHAADIIDTETGRKVVGSLPLLVIDDESDHGSVDTGENSFDENGAPDLEHSPTTINRLIRELLNSFSRKAYVGYTATPFANIFIHEKGKTEKEGADLFPSAFITSLGAPTNYIGPGRVFGSSSSVPDDLPLTRTIDEQGFNEWMPATHKNGWKPRIDGEKKLPESLAEAVRSFIFACAVRKVRGQGHKHSSMLIHVSRFTSVQGEIVEQVDDHVRGMKRRYDRNIDLDALDDIMRNDYLNRFWPGMARIRDEFEDVPQGKDVTWDDVRETLPSVLADIQVREINGSAKDALDYAENEQTGLKVIAVGGNKLARGLTLEGLCTSFFVRTTKMYDTLMQMGRWFGYRDSYLDVCRLYTSDELIEWFGHIADAAEELRQEFDNMVAIGASPKDFGLKVKSHSILTVTSRTKMRNARPIDLSYAGDLLQTITFPLDKQHEDNFESGSAFVRSLGVTLPLQQQHYITKGQNWDGHLWRNVEPLKVIEFLRAYQTHPTSMRVVSPLIADFIAEMNKDGELTRWTVALRGAQEGERFSIGGAEVGMHGRSGVGDQGSRHAIKSLISSRDQAIDLTEAQYEAALSHSIKIWSGDVERNQDSKPPKVPTGPAIRHILGHGCKYTGVSPDKERGLLTLYLLDPNKSKNLILDGRPPVLAWSVVFPGSSSKRRVNNAEYMGNSVLWGGINDLD
jgi:hypothetical protein